MGRPRSFDADAVLDRAIEVFRAKGFDGASVEELEKATRLGRQSLYGAFGDKHSLYLSALDRYDRTRVESLVGKLSEGTDAADSIERFLRFVVDEEIEGGRNGCLIANATMDRGSSDPAVSRIAGANRRKLERLLESVLRRGLEDGSVGKSRDPKAVARFLVGTVLGLRALSKSGCSRAELLSVAGEAVRALS